VANSGDYAQVANSGDYAKVANSGNSCVIASIGIFGICRSYIGSWVTLAYYEKNKSGMYCPVFVKTEFVDGVKIKENVDYCLYKSEFREVLIIDGTKTCILNKKGQSYRVWVVGDDKESFVFEENGVYAHGKTLKEARDSLVYKIGDRDSSKYKEYGLDTKVSKDEAIKMYRVITGSCEYGVKRFIESQGKLKKNYTIKEIIEITHGQYGDDKFKHFFVASNE
jgi:hypothetical protein